MTKTLAHGYSSEGTKRELSNEYQHDRVKMVFKNLCVLVLWTKVVSALEGLSMPTLGSPMQKFTGSDRTNPPQRFYAERRNLEKHSFSITFFFRNGIFNGLCGRYVAG